jgi:hypothetical protein
MAQRTAATPPKKGFPVLPVLCLVLLVSAALFMAGVAGKARGKPVEGKAEEPAYVPFSSLPEELPPDRSGGPPVVRPRGGAVLGRAPDGGDEEPEPGSPLDAQVWHGALAEAKLGYELAREATRARGAGNHALYQEKGGGAKRAFDRALTQSTPWVERLLERRGDTDSSVRKALAIQGRWREQLILYHRTTGR